MNSTIKTYGNPPATLVNFCQRYSDRIEQIGNESGTNDGYWIYCRPGWWNREANTLCIHEYTVKDCIKMLKYIEVDPRPENER